MKPILYILRIVLVAILTTFPAFADDDNDNGSDSGDVIIIHPSRMDDKGERPRMPAANGYVHANYSIGVLSCQNLPNPDEKIHLRIYGTDGAILFETMCMPSDLITGIYVGQYESFTLVITTSTGKTYTGFY